MGSARICRVKLFTGKKKTRQLFFFFFKHGDANIKLQGLFIQAFCNSLLEHFFTSIDLQRPLECVSENTDFLAVNTSWQINTS